MKALAFFNPLVSDRIAGSVKFQDREIGCHVSISLRGLPPNSTHAIHIHEYGDLSKGCKSTGSHYNPTYETHGSQTLPSSLPQSRHRHVGDLINNIQSDSRGTVDVVYHDENFVVADIVGRAIVIHSLADDLGLGGIIAPPARHDPSSTFISYDAMRIEELRKLCLERGYYRPDTLPQTRDALAAKLNLESKRTGNAGGRVCCAVIGYAE